jgi:exonuclease SbcC
MAKTKNIEVDEKFQKKSEEFIENMNSDMRFKSEFIGDDMLFDWVKEIEFACPYIDNIIRNPKLTLVNEEDVVKIEKAKKISVTSIKDLSKHTHYIEKIDEKTNEVSPSKILIERREETFNTYENRFIYTLIYNLLRFIMRKESLLEDIRAKSDKVLEYAASTDVGNERVNIELKVSSRDLPKNQTSDDFDNEILSILARVKKIKDYIISWRRSEFIETLERDHASFVVPPIKKTNMILKNPNFQIAMKLWEFLQTYDYKDNEDFREGLDTEGDNDLRGVLDDAFLMSYFVFDSVSLTKKEQKEKLSKYAVIMLSKQVQRVVSILLRSGIKITEDDLLDMISVEIKNEQTQRLVDSTDVKKKFKNAIDEYFERIKDYL